MDYEKEQPEYSYNYCVELKTHFSNKIRGIQSTLNYIKLWDDLNHFEELGVFNRSFLLELEWLHSVWLSDELFDPERVLHIEERLSRLPFEQAYSCKYPDDLVARTFHMKNDCVRDTKLFLKWRNDKSISMTDEDKTRMFKHFEYMCYFIINVRDEVLFDILEMR